MNELGKHIIKTLIEGEFEGDECFGLLPGKDLGEILGVKTAEVTRECKKLVKAGLLLEPKEVTKQTDHGRAGAKPAENRRIPGASLTWKLACCGQCKYDCGPGEEIEPCKAVLKSITTEER